MKFIDVIVKSKTQVICENDLFFAYLDDRPISAGHTLIFPKDINNSSYFDLDIRHLISLHDIIKDAKRVIAKKYHPDGWNIVINDGKQGGKIIDQFGLHLIPRYVGDVHNPVASGARTVLGKFVEPARIDNKKFALNEVITTKTLKNATIVEADPNKKFYLGLKALIINPKGQILVIFPTTTRGFIGNADIPGGRCEARDKEVIPALQREVFEETGIYINQAMFFDTFVLWDKEFISEDEEPVGLNLNIYVTYINGSVITKLNKNRNFTSSKWVSPYEAADLLVQYPLRVRNKIKNLSVTD